MSLSSSSSNPFELVRPFVWLAAFAFVLGFASYLAAGAGSVAKAYSRGHQASAISASQIDWDTRKAI